MAEMEKRFRLKAVELGLSWPETGRQILRPVTFELRAASRIELRGPSGSGKTTFLRSLARLSPKTQGRLQLNGIDAAEWSPHAWRTHVVYVHQHPVALPGTVRANLLAGMQLKVHGQRPRPGDAELADRMRQLNLHEVHLDQSAETLSGGELTRLALLRADLVRPSCLFLDEPDAMLDDDAKAKVSQWMDRFVQSGGCIVRVSHQAPASATLWKLVDGNLITTCPATT